MNQKELIEANYAVSQEIIEKYGKNNGYYRASELLESKDEDGNEPAAFISTNNRSSGKTSYWAMLSKKIWEMYKAKTVILVREVGELEGIEEAYGDVCASYGWPEVTQRTVVLRTCIELKLGEEGFAYVVPLKKYVALKKYSPIFRDVWLIVMDEYQLENGKFIKHELQAFRSVFRTVSRGGGQRSRNVKMLLFGNPVTLLNPYLLNFNISEKYEFGREYVKGKRVVAEFIINAAAHEEMKSNIANDLFESGNQFDCGEDFLLNDKLYMEKCSGKSEYLFTLVYGNKYYGVRRYKKNSCIHVGEKKDPSCQTILAFRENDRIQNEELLERRDYTWNMMREAYKYGNLRFDSMKAKAMVFDLMGIDMYGA